MKKANRKWLLALVAVCCMAPAAFAYGNGNGGWPWRPPQEPGKPGLKQVPEGGSTAIYLIGTGLACLGGIYVRSRVAKPSQS